MKRERRKLTRRTLVVGGAVGGCCTLAALPPLYFATRDIFDDGDDRRGSTEHTTPLAIPPLLEPEIRDGTKHFTLEMQTGESQILEDKTTPSWGINGPLLGPTIRASHGDKVSFSVTNNLPELSTLHWHGMHLPAAMDGGPHQSIERGNTWNPTWTIDQPASVLWFHPHPHGETARHVYMGVAGMFIVDDDETSALGLPDTYGVDDIPVIVQDRNFNGDGSFREGSSFLDGGGGDGALGIIGNTVMINGTTNAVFETTRSHVRLRVLNGSNTRFYNLQFADSRSFQLIATDNGLMADGPVELTSLSLGPAERAEIVVELARGDDVMLQSVPQQDEGGIQVSALALPGAKDSFDLLRFKSATEMEVSPPLPTDWTGHPAPEIPAAVTERRFSLDGASQINGKEMDMARIDEVIPAGATEIWHVESAGLPHTFHIHGATFHVIDVDGQSPPPYLRGPKDTVRVSNGHSVRLLVQFRDYTDEENPYMYHCHLLLHEDLGMMGQFLVVEPGRDQEVDRMLDDAHGH